MELPMVICQ
uniref:Uncharacterized protein n=1 Tax=Anguilla anguilla TaxID=7936 RepID=A0A0E9XZV8_ANGAN